MLNIENNDKTHPVKKELVVCDSYGNQINHSKKKKKNQPVILTAHIFQYLVKINDFSIHYFLGLKDQLIVSINCTKDHRLHPTIQLEIFNVTFLLCHLQSFFFF